MFVTFNALLIALVTDAIICVMLALYYLVWPGEQHPQERQKQSNDIPDLDEGTLDRLADRVTFKLQRRAAKESRSAKWLPSH